MARISYPSSKCAYVPHDPSFDKWNDAPRLLWCEMIHTNVVPAIFWVKHLRWCATRSIIRSTKSIDIPMWYHIDILGQASMLMCHKVHNLIHWFTTFSMWITLRSHIEVHINVPPQFFDQASMSDVPHDPLFVTQNVGSQLASMWITLRSHIEIHIDVAPQLFDQASMYDVPRDTSFDTRNDGLQLLWCESYCGPR